MVQALRDAPFIGRWFPVQLFSRELAETAAGVCCYSPEILNKLREPFVHALNFIDNLRLNARALQLPLAQWLLI